MPNWGLVMKDKQNGHKGTGRKVSRVEPYEAKTGLIRATDAKPLRVPPAKLLRAEQLLLQGESQRQVAKKLHVSRNTTSKIVESDGFQKVIMDSREKLFQIVPVALESFRNAVAVDGRLARDFLAELGVFPGREAMLALAAPKPSMTPEERGSLRQAAMVGCVLLETEKNFGPTLSEDMKSKLKQMESLLAEPD
jgi:transcriptional regulator with XRE-family HTH domain